MYTFPPPLNTNNATSVRKLNIYMLGANNSPFRPLGVILTVGNLTPTLKNRVRCLHAVSQVSRLHGRKIKNVFHVGATTSNVRVLLAHTTAYDARHE